MSHPRCRPHPHPHPRLLHTASAALLLWLLASPAHAQRIELLAGSSQGYAEGMGSAAQFYHPAGLALSPDGLTLFVSDFGGHRIRSIHTQTGQTALLAGSTSGASGNTDAQGAAALFNGPVGLAWDAQAGRLLVADSVNHRIRQVALDGTTTPLAGSNVGSNGYAEGTGSAALFNRPFGVTVDGSGLVYVTEYSGQRVRRIAADRSTSLLAGADNGATGQSGTTEGVGNAARFNGPWGIAVRPDGQVLVAEYDNHRFRQFSPGQTTSTLAGSSSSPGFADGPAASARFNKPNGLALDSAGRLFVAEYGNRIRMVLPDGTTSTIAGTGSATSTGDAGPASAATLNQPAAVAVDAVGNLYVADLYGHRIRKIILVPQTPGAVSAVPGSGQAQVSWTYPNAVADDVQRYEVSASPGGQSCTAIAPATSCTVSGLGTTVTFSVKAINRAKFESAAATFVYGPVVSSTGSLTGATVGTAYSTTLQATGGASPYTWAVTAGSLPPGLSLNTATGELSGTPSSAGAFPVSVTATDAHGVTSQAQNLSLQVVPAGLAITTTSLPDATEGAAYSQTLQASGGTAPYTWFLAGGSLPAGLSLNPATGEISGTLAKAALQGQAKAVGSFSFDVIASDAGTPPQTSVVQTLSIQVLAEPAVAGTVTPVPTLSDWALAMLGLLTASLGLKAQRRKLKA